MDPIRLPSTGDRLSNCRSDFDATKRLSMKCWKEVPLMGGGRYVPEVETV
jgi:hypothetical protein